MTSLTTPRKCRYRSDHRYRDLPPTGTGTGTGPPTGRDPYPVGGEVPRSLLAALRLASMAKVGVSPAEESVTLLKEEGSIMAYGGAVTTITFFTGPAPVEKIRERLVAIVAANPWLAGRLEKRRGEKLWRLTYDPAGPLRDGLFTVANPGEYSVHDVSYATIHKVLKASKLEVKGGSSSVNKGAVQLKCTVIPNGDNWALVMSISHTIADGYTYYSVYNMLSASAEIKPYSPVRKQSFSTDLPGAVGKPETQVWWSMGFLFNVVGRMVFGSKVESRCRLVDPLMVEAGKAAAKEDGDSPFVSTNDLLVASWAKLTRAQLLEMPLNLRNRLPGIDDADAGNYEWVVFYQEEDCQRPGQIRKSLTATPGKYMRCGRDPPRRLRSGLSLMRARYAIITNWATFAKALDLPGCEQRLHMPFFNISEVPGDLAFIFRATANETGVLMLTRKLRAQNFAGSVFGSSVDPVIFPE